MEQDLDSIRQNLLRTGLLLTVHADEEAIEENVSIEDIRAALLNGVILEDYPEHRRGPCCLIYGQTTGGRHLHIVVTKDKEPVRVITVYEPSAPHWRTPTERG